MNEIYTEGNTAISPKYAGSRGVRGSENAHGVRAWRNSWFHAKCCKEFV